MSARSYDITRQRLTTYFDRTASDAWEKLTSDEPVGRVRQSVRAGREQMQATLLSWLPDDMRDLRVLDAGCGTGTAAIAMAKRGASVTAVDISPTLVGFAAERAAGESFDGDIRFEVGDMRDESLGGFDFVLAMDSLIHYRADDIAGVLASLASRVNQSMLVTFAPRTALLSMMHFAGRLIPTREHKAPAIVPVTQQALETSMRSRQELDHFEMTRSQRIASGFYKSQALEVRRR